MKRAAAVAMAILLSGCSILFVEKVRVTGDHVSCTDSYTYPLVDGAAGVAGIATPFILEALRDRRASNPKFALYVPLWTAGVIDAVSSIVGMARVRHCRRVRPVTP